MKVVYGDGIVNAGVFDAWEMAHGLNKLGGQAYFVVRAAHAVSCSVLLMAAPNASGTPRNVSTLPMSLTAERHFWASVPTDSALHAALYRYAYSDGWELLATNGHFGEALDPASRWAFDQGSLVVDAGSGAEQSWSRVADLNVIGGIPERLQVADGRLELAAHL